MFFLLSRVLLWLLIGTIALSLFQRFYPSSNYVGRLVVIVLFVVLALSFFIPNEPAVVSLWNVISFPLKPLGASILFLIFAAQKLKDGAIEKPGGFLIAWALTILLLSSTPAVAYFLVRSPAAMMDNQIILSQSQQTLLASNPQGFGVSDMTIQPYLLQSPQRIARRGLRLEDFVPNAQTLALTTRVWDSYLSQIYFFLRGRS
ncbi:MAG: hypothetical protein QNJ51_03215 [Calothrix sp. MO_167.B12]|nr:hypothetical protein [Calothrix sp. MO_167.B12]